MTSEQWQEVKERFSEALAKPPDVRHAFLISACSGEIVCAEVERLLGEYKAAGDFLSKPLLQRSSMQPSPPDPLTASGITGTVAISVDPPPNGASIRREQGRCGPYRLLRLLGDGGMGSVHLAERADGEVEQFVAIKFLHHRGWGPDFRDRFLRERQILAKLSHPGIARLLNAGHTEDGQPYLVMDYIDGVPIDAYAEPLDVRRKLILFLQVCEAVAYAHRSLVIHRDLKPSNIFVDGAGRPKLLDFGIAKMLDDSLDQTQTMDRVLTPRYASPEQIRGGAQTTATDIYSLGAVLYELLTGKSPHAFEGAKQEDITEAICTKTPVAASRLNPALSRDLDFILGKALRKEASERYPSVDAFADDIQGFLEWRPVRARSGDTWYRMRRFVRRYRLPVAAVALTIAALFIGLFIANRERQVAQHRFSQVRKLAKQFIDLDGDVKKLPGSTKVRSRIVSESLEYLAALGTEARHDPDLAFEIGSAYLQVARVQGVPTGPNLGKFTEAEESLRKADSFVDVAVKLQPGNRRALLASAEIAHDQMVLLDMQARRDEAMAQAKVAASRLERLFAHPSQDPQEIRMAARLYGDMGVACDNNSYFEDAIRYCRRAEAISRSKDAAHSRSVVLAAMATALVRLGDLDGALRAAREELALVEHGTGSNPMVQQQNLANAFDHEGAILGSDEVISLGRTQEALADFKKGLAIAEDLAKNDPADASSRMLIARMAGETGDILRHADPHAALAVYDQALKRTRETNVNALSENEEAALLTSSSYAARWVGRSDDAKQRIDGAFRVLGDAKEYPAGKIEPFSEPDRALRALADHYAETRDPEKAIAVYREDLNKLTAWNTDPHADLQTASIFSQAWTGISRVLRQTGRNDEAAAFDARRAELWSAWNRKLPNNSYVLRQMAVAPPSPTGY
ncbi:MAG TPA: protein kinase [Bryobacteraceae bacterium]|jgi:tetratricopeptide (TPR) repeat protein|nr:protein kinase [Bryobacteraceae bacterium]